MELITDQIVVTYSCDLNMWKSVRNKVVEEITIIESTLALIYMKI